MITSALQRFLVPFLFGLQFVLCDIYLHNPRGSNNRLKENSRNVQNNQRLFDSQNNNAGGLNVGDVMKYIAGSKLRIEWTVQHSCGDENANCEVILQYMCARQVKDGKMTITPPDTNRRCKRKDCNIDPRFGTHESFEYYRECKSRQRNMNLYSANLSRRKKSALHTRQNRNGKRYGYECPEEKDYYPYWAPTPWRDIAIFTNNVSRCSFYRSESQNVKRKFYCKFPAAYWKNQRDKKDRVVLYNNENDCVNSMVTVRGKQYSGSWVEALSHGIEAPDCLKSVFTRDNHHGNTMGGEIPFYDWTIPELSSSKCILRARYNVSTNDFNSWTERDEPIESLAPTHTWERFDLEKTEAARRGYYLKNDPSVDMFNLRGTSLPKFKLDLAIDTQQYGRTFEDRSHVFAITSRPDGIRGEIHNINVRGKRGNIVEVYPSTEYDFVPNKLMASMGDYVHFQWTGSNTNPARNDGEGRTSTDRHNVVELRKQITDAGKVLTFGMNYPTSNDSFLGLEREVVFALSQSQTGGPLLDRSQTYFDLGPQRLTRTGSHYYMCTRNNNFSNRDQKAVIIVGDKCYKSSDRGSSYNGFVNVATSGKECIRWDKRHPRTRPDRVFRSELVDNFCRNPHSTRHSSPWCYVNNGRRKIMERCNIPTCRRG